MKRPRPAVQGVQRVLLGFAGLRRRSCYMPTIAMTSCRLLPELLTHFGGQISVLAGEGSHQS